MVPHNYEARAFPPHPQHLLTLIIKMDRYCFALSSRGQPDITLRKITQGITTALY
jgi:hypothetical protein